MGQVFSRLTLDVAQPRVGLLSIGEEEGKGTEITRKVNRNLTMAAHINFIGNVEPKAVFEGKADVVVCDGFTGNIFLKTSEAVALLIKTLTGRHIRSTLISAVGGVLSSGALRRLKKTTDPNEQPGAPLLGVDGIVIIQHGSATALGIKNAILGARREMDLDLTEHIRKGIEDLRSAIPAGENGR
jgi:glycerol-3-phosphate acyltransferase PlsX